MLGAPGWAAVKAAASEKYSSGCRDSGTDTRTPVVSTAQASQGTVTWDRQLACRSSKTSSRGRDPSPRAQASRSEAVNGESLTDGTMPATVAVVRLAALNTRSRASRTCCVLSVNGVHSPEMSSSLVMPS